ncbi:MAG: hypothetical protein LLF94_03720 [Chlamydiales bacterium]|nr:hypothetical protein [Chlamydiales bacterium]
MAAETLVEPNVVSIETLGIQSGIQTTGAPAITGTVGANDTFFNGTLGDLQKKFPEVYDKLIIQSIGYQICQQCKQSNDRYIEEMKRNRRD